MNADDTLPPKGPARGPTRADITLGARALRAALGLLLLLGPLIGAELFMREQVRWLRPVLRRANYAVDMKLLFLDHRGACPDLVTLGTSLTDFGLPPRYLAEHHLMGAKIEDPFDFATAEIRGTTILAQYRWLRRRCKPRWITVEVSPVIINGEHGGLAHDPVLMDAVALWGMPEGFAELRGYSASDQLELVTYDRLLIHRRRRQIAERAINQLEAERWFMSEAERAVDDARQARRPREPLVAPDELEFDGSMVGMRRGLDDRAWAREERKRRAVIRRGRYKWKVNEPEQAAIELLVREAAAEGVVVILHAPPVTALYHSKMAPKLGMAADFERFNQRMEALADELDGVVFHGAHTDTSYELRDFGDWVHLSKHGSRRYTDELIEAANAGLRAERRGP